MWSCNAAGSSHAEAPHPAELLSVLQESATAEQRLAVKKQQTFTVELNIKKMGSSMIPRSITANFR